jgi:type II restriction/modification system DNA methylase subunit YeeA
MNEKQLKDIFKQGYNFQYWKQVLDFVFGKVEYFSTPNNPFEEDKKVISGKQYGRIKLEDAKSIALFEVQVDDSVDIERNRQGLREIAAKHIDQNITHGAIVFFYSATQENYRFTFIAKWSDIDLETGELQKGETQKKRYTYLLGSNQSGTTAAKRLLELANRKPVIAVKDIIQAFSVEALTKEFFKKYKEHYERFWRFIDDKPAYQKLLLDNSEEKNEDEKRKPIRDFSKKLLGRIVFLHFLQKKGWLGCPVLPTKKENEEIWIDGNPNFMMELFRNFNDKEHFYSKCLTALFFNTLNEPDRKNNVFAITNNRVPYLNGGLFDNDQPHTDGINFPANYFQELLEFFEQYNFTIDENSPDEQEVGIDPEMLGHIFENLLEENREKGAFYTPKEIVYYMCQESLVQYLKNHLPEEAQVEEFIRQQNVSAYLRDKANAIRLNQLLDEVKVCDPAIGSGAFPIGILQEIYKAKIHIYPYLKSQTPFNPAETKKKIIEESIYGVDIEHGAVEIARLRFWLSLVVDEDIPQPLPNLDYKIMQGNSLLEKFEEIDLSQVGSAKKNVKVVEPERDLFGNIKDGQLKMTFTQSETVKEIQKLIKKYFNEKKPIDKAELQNQINSKVHQHIDYNLELRESQLLRLITEAGNGTNLNARARVKLEGLKNDLTALTQKRAKLHKIQNLKEKPYFIWHLFFKDVFDNNGFDIVIGNPPYIQLQKDGGSLAKLFENNGYETFGRMGDIYSLFYEKGYELLKEKGILCYITSNKWMRTGYGESTRKFFSEKTNPVLLIDFAGQKIFESATVDTNILLLSKEKNQFKTQACIVKEKVLIDLSVFVRQAGNSCAFVNADSWVILSDIEKRIKEKIEQVGTPLKDWDIQINYGIKTGLNEAFIIDGKKRKELIEEDSKSEEIIRPILRGRDIKRYGYEFADQYLITTFPSLKIDIEQYPAVKQHLLSFGYDRLKQTGDPGARKKTNNKWFETQDSISYWEDFSKQKIVWGNLNLKASYAIAPEGFFVNAPCPMIVPANRYILAVLNSKIADYYIRKLGVTRSGGYFEYKPMFIEQLPVPFISSELQKQFDEATNLLLTINSDDKRYPKIENEIDEMIYKIYSLTSEEADFVRTLRI